MSSQRVLSLYYAFTVLASKSFHISHLHWPNHLKLWTLATVALKQSVNFEVRKRYLLEIERHGSFVATIGKRMPGLDLRGGRDQIASDDRSAAEDPPTARAAATAAATGQCSSTVPCGLDSSSLHDNKFPFTDASEADVSPKQDLVDQVRYGLLDNPYKSG